MTRKKGVRVAEALGDTRAKRGGNSTERVTKAFGKIAKVVVDVARL